MPLLRTLALCALLTALGCSSTRQIETAPPQPATAAEPEPEEAPTLASLRVVLAVGETDLPEDVEALRFRVAEVLLKARGGEWTTYPAEMNTFEVTARQRPQKMLLSTRVPPVAYDSLALSLQQVYVAFDANAGGPLTMPREGPVRLPVALAPTVESPTTVRLTLEPGASLSRTPACRWHFLPFFNLATP